VTDHGARLTLWNLEDLAAEGEPYQAGLVGINQMSYGPSLESPVAFSNDGSLIAHLDPAGEAVVRRISDGQVLLDIPRPPVETERLGLELFNSATAFRFTPNDTGLLVAFEAGMELWQCPDLAPVPSPGILGPVTLQGPTGLKKGDKGTWIASADHDGQPILFRFILDGDIIETDLEGILELQLYDEAAHSLQVIADDGVNTAASTLLEIAPGG
jgi:hypothetical protein